MIQKNLNLEYFVLHFGIRVELYTWVDSLEEKSEVH